MGTSTKTLAALPRNAPAQTVPCPAGRLCVIFMWGHGHIVEVACFIFLQILISYTRHFFAPIVSSMFGLPGLKGTAAVREACPLDGMAFCSSCQDGFRLQNNTGTGVRCCKHMAHVYFSRTILDPGQKPRSTGETNCMTQQT